MFSSKNFLPLLAVTALVLSVGLANFTQVSDSKVTNTRSVLSESDENKVEEDKKVEVKQTEQKESTEAKNEVKLTTGKIEIDNDEDEKELDENEVEENGEDVDVDKDETDNEQRESEFEQESETIASDGTVNKFKFKLKTRVVNGKTVIETARGEMQVKNSPEDSVSNLVNTGILDTPTSFEAKTNKNNKIEFEVQGVEVKKLLGLFEVSLPKTVTVNAETGDVVDLNQSIWTKFLSLLSI